MLFTEPTFLFLFLPILLALYFSTFRRVHSSYGNWLPLIFSIIFYAKGGGSFTRLILGSIVFNYFVAIAVDRARGSTPSPRPRDADDDAIEDFARVTPLTPEAVANWRTALLRANGWLQARHVAYVFTIAPDKHVLYPEEMPSSVSRVSDLSRTDQLLTALQDAGFAVDLRPALVGAKAKERIYQRTDTHWNDRGAFAAYRQIIRAMRARVPAVPPEWTRDDFEPASREVDGGDLAGMMGLKRVLREEDLPLAPRRRRRAVVVEPPGAAPTAEEGYLVTEIPGSTLPRAVIFRDSFVSQMVPFLSEHFSRAVYVWQNDFDADLVSREKPDVVIQEIVGRHLYGFIPSPELVPPR